MKIVITFVGLLFFIYCGYVIFVVTPKNIEEVKRMSVNTFAEQLRGKYPEAKVKVASKCIADNFFESEAADKQRFYIRSYLDSFFVYGETFHDVQLRLLGILMKSTKRDNPTPQDIKNVNALEKGHQECLDAII